MKSTSIKDWVWVISYKSTSNPTEFSLQCYTKIILPRLVFIHKAKSIILR